MSVEMLSRTWRNSRMMGSPLLLLLALADAANDDGVVVVDKALLADKCRRSVGWVEQTLGELERGHELARLGPVVVVLAGRDREDVLADAKRILEQLGVGDGK